MDCSPSGSVLSVCGISQAKILEWAAIPFPGDLPGSGIEPAPPALAGGFFSAEPPGKLVIWVELFNAKRLTSTCIDHLMGPDKC